MTKIKWAVIEDEELLLKPFIVHERLVKKKAHKVDVVCCYLHIHS